jgi:hypothetical protein
VIVPLPQVPVSPFGVATTNPAGKVSVKLTPLSATVFPAGLVIVNVRLVVPFNGILAAPNALLIVGGATTVTLAEAVPPVPPSVELTALVVLFCIPAAIPVTFTENVHEPLAAMVPLLSVMEVLFGFAVIDPVPQEPARPFGAATWSPAGKLSVNATPLKL